MKIISRSVICMFIAAHFGGSLAHAGILFSKFSAPNRDHMTPIGGCIVCNSAAELRPTCHCTCEALAEERVKRARKRIARIVGELIDLEAGTFIKGPICDQESPWRNHEEPTVEKVEAFSMQALEISQRAYEEVMGPGYKENIRELCERNGLNPDRWIGPDLPILGLIQGEEDAYIDELNKILRALWPSAYPDNEPALVQLEKPTDVQRIYATTKPILAPDGATSTQEVLFGETRVPITAQQQLHPVPQNESGHWLLPEDRDLSEGPRNVNDRQHFANFRKIRGLARTMMEPTVTLFNNRPSTAVLLGGSFGLHPAHCSSVSRLQRNAHERNLLAGLRLVRRLGTLLR